MNSLIVALIYISSLYSSAQAFSCNDGTDPCDLKGIFNPSRGYQCIPNGPGNVICTCPDGFEDNVPCRLCARVKNPLQNVCRNTNGKLVTCLEGPYYGNNYACLCTDGLLTSNADCDTSASVTLTTRPPTTTGGGSSVTNPCVNGGIFFNGVCNCPSGFSGPYCAEKNPPNLCQNVVCMNNGTCAIREPNGVGVYEAVCLCRYGTWGDYCELIGTLGFCSPNLCLNGGACQENVVGATRHAYCHCQGGYNGAKCENRYFACPNPGKFADPVMYSQGKYFDCTNVGGVPRIEQKSCPRGLRFNANAQLCSY